MWRKPTDAKPSEAKPSSAKASSPRPDTPPAQISSAPVTKQVEPRAQSPRRPCPRLRLPRPLRSMRPRRQKLPRTTLRLELRLASGLKIRGELSGSSDLYIDGDVQGKINLAGSRVTVGPNGRIQADIEAGEIVVEGSSPRKPQGSRQRATRLVQQGGG